MGSNIVTWGEHEPTPEERAKVLEIVKAEPRIGTTTAMRRAGLEGTMRELRRMVDEEFAEQIRLARGWDLRAVEDTRWKVALDPEHPRWEAASASVLKQYAGWGTERVQVTGDDESPVHVRVDGGRVTGLTEVFELARQFGIGLAAGAREGLGAGDAGTDVPAIGAVLPDPADGEPAASPVAADD